MENPTYPKKRPFYCCNCKCDTDGLSTCHICGHSKGRWITDGHHCISEEEKEKMNQEATKELHKLLARSKQLGFH